MCMPKTPSMPDYAQEARTAAYWDVATYPQLYATDQRARLGTGRFKGMGDVDYARTMSDQMAQAMLDIQKEFGGKYVAQRLEALEKADPEGYAARRQLFERIKADALQNPDRPLAADLQQSLLQELSTAGRLDAKQLEQVQQQVRGSQIARGNYLGQAATTREAQAVAQASEQNRAQTQANAAGFLASGVTPEDVQYRRVQQSLANLTNFAQGRTPSAQFRGLTSAGNTAAPFLATTPNQQAMDPNAVERGISQANQIYSGQLDWKSQQVNPWLAGLSTGVSSYGAFSQF